MTTDGGDARRTGRAPASASSRDGDGDVCGRLPSGEICTDDADHSGPHRKLRVTLVPTDYQDPCDGTEPHNGPWEKVPGSDGATRCVGCGTYSGK